jgi:hypothetical protein
MVTRAGASLRAGCVSERMDGAWKVDRQNVKILKPVSGYGNSLRCKLARSAA